MDSDQDELGISASPAKHLVPDLLELAAKTVGKYMEPNDIVTCDPSLDDTLYKKVLNHAFPATCYAIDFMKVFLAKDGDYDETRVKNIQTKITSIKQVGFLLVSKLCDPSTLHPETYTVTVEFGRQRITEVNCTKCKTTYGCIHVYATVLYRMNQPDKVNVYPPLTETLHSMSKTQLQKLLHKAVSKDQAYLIELLYDCIDEARTEDPEDAQVIHDPTVSTCDNDGHIAEAALEKFSKTGNRNLQMDFHGYTWNAKNNTVTGQLDKAVELRHVNPGSPLPLQYIHKVGMLVNGWSKSRKESYHKYEDNYNLALHDLLVNAGSVFPQSENPVNIENINIEKWKQVVQACQADYKENKTSEYILKCSKWVELPRLYPLYEDNIQQVFGLDKEAMSSGLLSEALASLFIPTPPPEYDALISGEVSPLESTYDEPLAVMMTRANAYRRSELLREYTDNKTEENKQKYLKTQLELLRLVDHILIKLANMGMKYSILSVVGQHIRTRPGMKDVEEHLQDKPFLKFIIDNAKDINLTKNQTENVEPTGNENSAASSEQPSSQNTDNLESSVAENESSPKLEKSSKRKRKNASKTPTSATTTRKSRRIQSQKENTPEQESANASSQNESSPTVPFANSTNTRKSRRLNKDTADKQQKGANKPVLSSNGAKKSKTTDLSNTSIKDNESVSKTAESSSSQAKPSTSTSETNQSKSGSSKDKATSGNSSDNTGQKPPVDKIKVPFRVSSQTYPKYGVKDEYVSPDDVAPGQGLTKGQMSYCLLHFLTVRDEIVKDLETLGRPYEETVVNDIIQGVHIMGLEMSRYRLTSAITPYRKEHIYLNELEQDLSSYMTTAHADNPRHAFSYSHEYQRWLYISAWYDIGLSFYGNTSVATLADCFFELLSAFTVDNNKAYFGTKHPEDIFKVVLCDFMMLEGRDVYTYLRKRKGPYSEHDTKDVSRPLKPESYESFLFMYAGEDEDSYLFKKATQVEKSCLAKKHNTFTDAMWRILYGKFGDVFLGTLLQSRGNIKQQRLTSLFLHVALCLLHDTTNKKSVKRYQRVVEFMCEVIGPSCLFILEEYRDRIRTLIPDTSLIKILRWAQDEVVLMCGCIQHFFCELVLELCMVLKVYTGPYYSPPRSVYPDVARLFIREHGTTGHMCSDVVAFAIRRSEGEQADDITMRALRVVMAARVCPPQSRCVEYCCSLIQEVEFSAEQILELIWDITRGCGTNSTDERNLRSGKNNEFEAAINDDGDDDEWEDVDDEDEAKNVRYRFRKTPQPVYALLEKLKTLQIPKTDMPRVDRIVNSTHVIQWLAQVTLFELTQIFEAKDWVNGDVLMVILGEYLKYKRAVEYNERYKRSEFIKLVVDPFAKKFNVVKCIITAIKHTME